MSHSLLTITPGGAHMMTQLEQETEEGVAVRGEEEALTRMTLRIISTTLLVSLQISSSIRRISSDLVWGWTAATHTQFAPAPCHLPTAPPPYYRLNPPCRILTRIRACR
jgi:hypothetical protein